MKILAYNIDTWHHWLPANGRSGGIILGANSAKVEISDVDIMIFSVSVDVTNSDDNYEWKEYNTICSY